jgi:hypothetical protein
MLGALLLTLGAVALAFYVGMMYERKGMSKQLGITVNTPGAATPTPAPTRPAEAAFSETPAEHFARLRAAVDLSPATEAARMSTEANGQPLASNDPEFLYLYGRALLLSDRQPEAAAAFDRAIQRINENMTPANGELKIDARLAKVAAHLRAGDASAAREAADALSEVVRAQQTPAANGENVAASPTP